MNVNCYYEREAYKIINEERIEEWISIVIKNEKKQLGIIQYKFVDSKELRKINVDFLGHDYDTDIITFDESFLKVVSGEVYIAIEFIKENSKVLQLDFESELYRVIVHGVLHLIGYNDLNTEERKLMRKAENKYLRMLKDI